MIEKIKELAQQSGIKFTPFTVDGEEYDFDEVEVEDSDMLQNFAELIVQECLKNIRDMLVDGSEGLYHNDHIIFCVNERLWDTHDNIAELFGVEQ